MNVEKMSRFIIKNINGDIERERERERQKDRQRKRERGRKEDGYRRGREKEIYNVIHHLFDL